MLYRILGSIWTILGLIWFIKPEMLRNRIKRKMNRRIRLVVYLFLIAFGFVLISSVFKAEGLAAKLAGIIGLVLTIKVIMIFTSRTSGKMLEWLGARSILFFRLWAAVVLVVGVMLMFV